MLNPPLVRTAALACALAAMLSMPALAQDRHGAPGRHGPERAGPPPGLRLDQRYHHDHYYPRQGHAVPVLPSGAIGLSHGNGHFYFHGGVWFRPWGSRFVVTVPPIGIIVPLLPPAYVTLWIGGAPYYYANGVYYTPAPGPGYVVVAPPPGADSVPPAAPPPPPTKLAPDPVIYPRSGQSAAQQEADMQECNRWATTQPNAVADASVFQRAVAACMDGRGYTVK